jgi:quinone-modifying oxidoreductase, subunit QmoC
MAIRVNPKLIDELERYGADDVKNCYHCGNCSAVCPHTDETYVFPRRSMRLLQMGLEQKLETSILPWLCYYCGQCSEQCPRDAEPGETMMSLRRWLISRYDFTGLARRYYESRLFELGATLLVALGTAVGLLLYGFSKGNIRVYDGPGAFLPSPAIHSFDYVLGATVLAFLAVNALRMWWLTMIRSREISVPLWLYIKRIYLLPAHFVTQMRYARCGEKWSWLVHLGLVFGYVTMLVLILFYLEPFQAGPAVNWRVHVFGYLASIGLLGATTYLLYSRIWTRRTQHRHTQFSDWTFLVLLLIVAATGVLQHLSHRLGYPTTANIVYVVHLSAVVTWFSRYPFTKWAHIIYRPIAMYFSEIRREALAARHAAPAAAPQLQKA